MDLSENLIDGECLFFFLTETDATRQTNDCELEQRLANPDAVYMAAASALNCEDNTVMIGKNIFVSAVYSRGLQ